MSTDELYEITGEATAGYRPFRFRVPLDAVFFIGSKETPRFPGGVPAHEARGVYPNNRTTGWCYVTYTTQPFRFGELSPYDLHFESDIYPGEHNTLETRSVWAGREGKPQCVSPPEWNDSRQAFRVRQSNPDRGESFYIEFCPIPEEDFNPARAAKADAFWHVHDNPPPPCTPERVIELLNELGSLVPTTPPRGTKSGALGPKESKYPEALESYFSEIRRLGLDEVPELFPRLSALPREEALDVRKDLTGVEKQFRGRVPRFPGNLPWASGLFPIAYRDGWGLAVDVASKKPGTVWKFWPPEAMYQTHGSLCTLLEELVAAYRGESTFDVYTPELAEDGSLTWHLTPPSQ